MDNEQKPITPPPDLGAAIERLMANPELIATVASALGSTKPPPAKETALSDEESSEQEQLPALSLSNEAKKESDPSTPDLQRLVATLSPLLSGAGGGKKDDPRACLLRALKPYVSPARREAIDTMIRLSLISDALRQIR